jgi:hypothetical protein
MKTFLACALVHAAVRRGHTALYVRSPRLLAELALSRGDGRYVQRLAQLAKIGVLVLDDFLITTPSLIEAKDLLEVIDDRSQLRSTVVVTQLPVEDWHAALTAGDPTWLTPYSTAWSTTPTASRSVAARCVDANHRLQTNQLPADHATTIQAGGDQPNRRTRR